MMHLEKDGLSIRLKALKSVCNNPEAFADAQFEATSPDCFGSFEITLSTIEAQMNDDGTEDLARARLKAFVQAILKTLT